MESVVYGWKRIKWVVNGTIALRSLLYACSGTFDASDGCGGSFASNRCLCGRGLVVVSQSKNVDVADLLRWIGCMSKEIT